MLKLRGTYLAAGAMLLITALMGCQAQAQAPMPSARDYPVPQPPVTAQDYFEMAQIYPEPIFPNPRHGIYGPRHGLSALAYYHFTKDPQYAAYLLEAMYSYYEDVLKQIENEGGVHYSWEGPYLWGLILRELRADNLLNEEHEEYIREMMITLAERLSSWSPTLNYTRGQQHRAQGESCARALALFWYPDIPQAEQWKAYSETVWNDWWQFRDIGINDTGYFFGALQRVMLTAELMGRTEVWTDPEMREFWDRYLYEVAPDGSNVPYGASSGWCSSIGDRILAMELAAKHTGDGRYRWVAHRMLNYLRARGGELKQHNHVYATTLEPIGLAAVLADDSIEPVEPDPASRVLYRKETTRLSNEEAAEQYPGWGTLDCNMGMTQRVMPHKLILRSGWEPNDLFMMVEAYTRHDPLNPTAILGLTRYGSTQTVMASEKFVSRENAIKIEDLQKQATYLGQAGYTGDRAVPTGYAGMECTVEPLVDGPLATYAQMRVTNYMGYEVEQTREFLFVKNRFALVRDVSQFQESFPTRIGPVWNTHTVDRAGPNWVNSYFPYAASLAPAYFFNPRWDLLVYHSPAGNRRMEMSRREGDLVEFTAPISTRYVWEGTPAAQEQVCFGWLLIPHDPAQSPDRLAEGIRFLRDTPELMAAVVRAEEDREEWVVLNNAGGTIALEEGDTGVVSTDARRLYLDCRGGQVVRYWAQDATVLQVGGREVFSQAERGDVSFGPRVD